MTASRRLVGIQESFIREMTRLAMTHQAVNLSQGFPDFDPPSEVLAAAHRALDTGVNQYTVTWGLPELRHAIARKMHALYNLDYDPERHITVTCGVTEALMVTALGLLDPGDEVILLEPFHESYIPAVRFAGADPKIVTLEPPAYALDLDRLRIAFTPRVRALVLNSPHNPTGRVFTAPELAAIAELCQAHDVLAITDEIYEHILYDGREHLPLASLPGMQERTVTIGGFGKTYAITGWRIGYACAPDPLSSALRAVHDFTTICAPTTLQAACIAALDLPLSYYAELRRNYAARRAAIMAILRDIQMTAEAPEGAYYVLADFSAWDFDGDDFDFARWLPANLGVAVVPGSTFYATPGLGRKFVRFAFAKKLETLQTAADRLRRGRLG